MQIISSFPWNYLNHANIKDGRLIVIPGGKKEKGRSSDEGMIGVNGDGRAGGWVGGVGWGWV